MLLCFVCYGVIEAAYLVFKLVFMLLEKDWTEFLVISALQKAVLVLTFVTVDVIYYRLASRHFNMAYRKHGCRIRIMSYVLLFSTLLSIIADLLMYIYTKQLESTMTKREIADWIYFATTQIPVIIFAIITPKDDFMDAHNMYPEMVSRISWVQYKRALIGYDSVDDAKLVHELDAAGRPYR